MEEDAALPARKGVFGTLWTFRQYFPSQRDGTQGIRLVQMQPYRCDAMTTDEIPTRSESLICLACLLVLRWSRLNPSLLRPFFKTNK